MKAGLGFFSRAGFETMRRPPLSRGGAAPETKTAGREYWWGEGGAILVPNWTVSISGGLWIIPIEREILVYEPRACSRSEGWGFPHQIHLFFRPRKALCSLYILNPKPITLNKAAIQVLMTPAFVYGLLDWSIRRAPAYSVKVHSLGHFSGLLGTFESQYQFLW